MLYDCTLMEKKMKKKKKEYSYALPTINIPKDRWCEPILKDHQTRKSHGASAS